MIFATSWLISCTFYLKLIIFYLFRTHLLRHQMISAIRLWILQFQAYGTSYGTHRWSLNFNYKSSSSGILLDSSELRLNLSLTLQSCTEMIMPMCTDDTSTMFEKKVWDIDKVSNNCFKQFKVRPSVNLVRDLYGGKNIKWATNIIFR